MSASQKSKAKEPEIIDTTGDPEFSDNHSDSEGEEQEDDKVASAPSTSTSQKKKKKKKSRAKKILNAIRGNEEIPQAVVDQVLDKVKAEGGPGSSEANAENVRLALQEMKIMEVVKGKAGVGGLNKKDLGEHKVRHYSRQLKRVMSITLPSFGAPNPFHN
jgi:glycylpeptide N-tetradecanoyltransferase